MQVGKRVVCVDDQFQPWALNLFKELPVKGRTYTVRAVSLGRMELARLGPDGKLLKNGASDASPTVRILLEELHNPDDPCGPTNNKGGTEMGFNADRFRELEDTENENELVIEHTITKPVEEIAIHGVVSQFPLPLQTGPIRGRTTHLCILDDANWPHPISEGEAKAIQEYYAELRKLLL